MGLYRFLLHQMIPHAQRNLFQHAGVTYKYKDIFSWISASQKQMSRRLKGVNAPRIGIMNHNHPSVFVTIMSAWSFGATVILFPPYLRQDEQRYLFQITRPHVVYSDIDRALEKSPMIPFPEYSQYDDVADCVDVQKNHGAIVLFSSGTTSLYRKPVVLSHENIISNLCSIGSRTPDDTIGIGDTTFTILPWYHCYGLVCELLFLCTRGATINISNGVTSPSAFFREMYSASPTLMFTVPRIIDRMLTIYKKMPLISPRVIHRFLFGTRLRYISVGGSKFVNSSEACHMFETCGTTIIQGYGLTEMSPMISLESPLERRNGSCGRPLDGITVRFDKEGQIITSGRNRYKGYATSFEELCHVIDHDYIPFSNTLHTGDIGYVDQDGYLFVTDRIGQNFKLSNGLFVNPEPMEILLRKELSEIDQVVIVGEGLDSPMVVVYAKQDIESFSLREKIQTILRCRFPEYVIPHHIKVIDAPMTVENGYLTLKMEPRRSVIQKDLIS